MGVLGVCLTLAALGSPQSGDAPVSSFGGGSAFIAGQTFTLAWTHSIEKVRWEEDYAVVGRANDGCRRYGGHAGGTEGQPVLRALGARIRGSAAGMEPPPDARLRNGWYEYTPTMQTPDALRLTRSSFAPDYEWCVQGRCRPLSDWLPSDGGVTLLMPCWQAPGT